MGIRVQKHLGYALGDVVPRDSRVNWEFEDGRQSGQEYLRWLNDRYGDRKVFPSLDWLTLRAEVARQSELVSECVSWDYESSAPVPLVVRPACLPSWSRTDDSIDYSADQLRGDMTRSRCEWLPSGIHPFDGQLMDAETGERLPREALTWRQVTRALESEPPAAKDDRRNRVDAMERFTKDLLPQYPDYQTAVARVVGCVPQEVRDVCEFLGLFTEEGTWRQMRPVLATWWG